MLARNLAVLAALFMLHGAVFGQLRLRDQSDPFLFAPGRGGGQANFGGGGFGGGAGALGGGGAVSRGITIKFPEAVSVNRPLKLQPPKPVMQLEATVTTDSRLAGIDSSLKTVIRKLRAARQGRNFSATRQLLREMEELRQRRLVRVREIAKLVVPEPKTTDDLLAPSTDDASGGAPVLPLPTAPRSFGSGN